MKRMDEYIKREDALDIFGDVPMWNGYFEPYPWEVHCAIVGVTKLFKEEISKIPAADAEPVKYGQWVQLPFNRTHIWRCSKCETIGSPQWNYCPKCGTKMDERDK